MLVAALGSLPLFNTTAGASATVAATTAPSAATLATGATAILLALGFALVVDVTHSQAVDVIVVLVVLMGAGIEIALAATAQVRNAQVVDVTVVLMMFVGALAVSAVKEAGVSSVGSEILAALLALTDILLVH